MAVLRSAWRGGAGCPGGGGRPSPPRAPTRARLRHMALLSAACPTLLASEPNHWGEVAGCTESASVHGATPSGAGCKDPRARPECGPFGELPRGFWFWVLGVREDTATTSKAMQGVHRLPHRIPRGSAAALRSNFKQTAVKTETTPAAPHPPLGATWAAGALKGWATHHSMWWQRGVVGLYLLW